MRDEIGFYLDGQGGSWEILKINKIGLTLSRKSNYLFTKNILKPKDDVQNFHVYSSVIIHFLAPFISINEFIHQTLVNGYK